MHSAMKPTLSAILLATVYLFHLVEQKTRGKGSWRTDRLLLRLQGALTITSILIWVI